MALPAHWATAELGDLVDIYDSVRVPLNKRQREGFRGSYPYYGANGVVDRVADYLFDGDFILIAEDGGHFDDPTRAVARKVGGRFWVNNHAHVVRARTGVDAAFLAYALGTVPWMDYVGGSTRLKLTQASLKLLPVPLTSTAEQIRLASVLTSAIATADRAADALKQAADLLDAYRASVMNAALSGGLTRQWRLDMDLAPWAEVRLGDHLTAIDYGSSAKSAKTGTVPVLRMGNIQGGKLDWSDLVYSSNEKEVEKYRLHRGDVLFNRTNSAELVGKTALYDEDRLAIHAGYLIRLKCDHHLDPAFLTYILNGPKARDYFSRVRSDGVNQSNINGSKLAELHFELPTLDEQNEIVKRLDRALAWADEMRVHIRAATSLLGRLRVGVVSKGFQGELTSVEPGDVSVRHLLADLKSETAAARSDRLKVDEIALVKRPEKKARRMLGLGGSGEFMEDLREGLLSLGGDASAADPWARSGLAIEVFYKRLRVEIAAGRILESREKGRLMVPHAS